MQVMQVNKTNMQEQPIKTVSQLALEANVLNIYWFFVLIKVFK